MQLINTELLAQPYNWIVVTLMVLFAVVALAMLQPLIGFSPPTATE